MKTKLRPKILIIIFICPMILLFLGCLSQSYNLVKEANELLIEEDIQNAKEIYMEAKETLNNSEALNYNIAQTTYLEGDIDSAMVSFDNLTYSENPVIRKKSFTGLGNALMKYADSIAKENPQQAFQLYTESINYYRKVIEEENNLSNNKSDLPTTEEDLKQKEILKEAYNNLERAIIKRNELELPDGENQEGDEENEGEDEDKKNQDDKNQNQDNSDNNQDQNNQEEKENQNQNQSNKNISPEEAKEMLDKLRAEQDNYRKQNAQEIINTDSVTVGKDW